MFKNLNVGKKIGAGFLVVLMLLTIVVGMNVLVLNKTNDGVNQYRGLAQDTNLIGRIQANVLMLCLNVTDYLISQSDTSIAEYQKYIAKVTESVEVAKGQIIDSERAAMIADIETEVAAYDIGFQEVITLIAERNKQYKRLSMFKEEMQNAIINMVKIAHENNNAEVSYYASDVQKEMFLGLLYVAKFLNTNDENDYKMAVKNIQDQLKTEITSLDKNLHTANLRDAFIDFKIAHTNYVRYLHKTYDVIVKRDTVIRDVLDIKGPEIATHIEDLKQSTLQYQERLGPELKENTDRSIGMSITLSGIAIAIGIIAAYLLTRAITQP